MELIAEGDGKGGDDEQAVEAAKGRLPEQEEINDGEQQKLHDGAENEGLFAVEQERATEQQEHRVLDVGVEVDDESGHEGVAEALFVGPRVPDEVGGGSADEKVDGDQERGIGPAV